MLRLPPLLVLTLACGGLGLPDGHDHEGSAHAEAEDPRPDNAVTLYQNGLELFMEFPSLVVGEESALIAHFTDTRDPANFVWVTEGSVVVTLRFADGTEETFAADKLLRNASSSPSSRPRRRARRRSRSPSPGTRRRGRWRSARSRCSRRWRRRWPARPPRRPESRPSAT